MKSGSVNTVKAAAVRSSAVIPFYDFSIKYLNVFKITVITRFNQVKIVNLKDISIRRFLNQQIGGSKFKTAGEAAMWMAAIQAQDYNMVKWAFGIRIAGSTEDTINSEINSGKIIRTHLLRPTWHFVAAEDIYWILDLTAPNIKAAMRWRDKQLGLTDAVVNKCKSVIEKALVKQNHLTREELIDVLVKAGIDPGENRPSHIFMRAEIDGLICSGKQSGGKPSYTLLEEWTPRTGKITRDEALMKLAGRYFNSRGPASLKDFIWWSGLSAGDSKLALELNRSGLSSEKIENQTYWFSDSVPDCEPESDIIYLVPAYDEYILSYRDRTAALHSTDNKKAVSSNGVFYPLIVLNGKVIGTWKRNTVKSKLILETSLFKGAGKDLFKKISDASVRYSEFVKKDTEIVKPEIISNGGRLK